MTVDHNNSLLNGDNLTQPIQIILCKKQKPFSAFFSPFLKSTLNFEPKKKMTLIADVFPKLRCPKGLIIQMNLQVLDDIDVFTGSIALLIHLEVKMLEERYK